MVLHYVNRTPTTSFIEHNLLMNHVFMNLVFIGHCNNRLSMCHYIYITFAFSHLADALIQSDVQ